MAAAAQPCTIGDMQLYVDGQTREMRTYIDNQNQSLRGYVDGRDFLTVERANSYIEQHLRDQRYVTMAEMRGAGFAPTKEVKEDLIEIVKRENLLVAELKEQMQKLFDQTQSYRRALRSRPRPPRSTPKLSKLR